MISDLASILDTGEFEDNGFVLVTSIARLNDDMTLTLSISSGIENQEPITRRINCQGVVTGNVSFDLAYSLQELRDDPALWSYTQSHGRLYFSRAPGPQHQCLLGALYSIHVEIVGDAIDAVPFGRGLNASNSLPGGYGLAFEGPMPLLLAYQRVLDEHGVTTSISGERPPKIWTGEEWMPAPKDLRLLLIGATWIVARSFVLDPSHNGAV